MVQRKFSSSRLYRLAKIIVIGVSILCGLYAIWAYSQIGTNVMLHSWQNYCSNTHGFQTDSYWSCMGVGFEQINSVQILMYKTGMTAILLPVLFFGGGWLVRYLFPEKK